MVGAEPTELMAQAGERFPLGQAGNVLPEWAGPPTDARPLVLRLARPVISSTQETFAWRYDPERQIATGLDGSLLPSAAKTRQTTSPDGDPYKPPTPDSLPDPNLPPSGVPTRRPNKPKKPGSSC